MTTGRTTGSNRNWMSRNNRRTPMNKSDSIASLAAALAKAQGEVENATKGSTNPHFRSKYADLAEVLNTVRPVFAKHGLAVTQFPSYAEGVVSVETVLTHSSGEWMSGTISAPVSKQDAQGVGSAVTYCRRYSLAAVAGIAQEDDDGNSAVGKPRDDGKKTASGAEYAELTKKYADAIIAIADGLREGTEDGLANAYEAWQAIPNDDKERLWKAPSNGGCFTTSERAEMQKPAWREAWFVRQGKVES